VFETTFVSNAETRRPWMVLVALAGQLLAVGALLAIPLLFVDSLPITQLTGVLLAPEPPAPPPPPPPPAQARVARQTRMASRKFDPNRLIAPRTIPKEVATIKDLENVTPPPADAVVGGVAGGIPGGVVGGVIGGILSAAPPPPPPPPPQKAQAPNPAAPKRIRIGGEVEAARLVHEVQPEYPVLARGARIGGVVRLSAVISRDGTVEDLKLVSGQPLLVPAAMGAVKQWIYKPTYLNGVPVEVSTEVDVDFKLSS
jgi:periplasmic protein TonB